MKWALFYYENTWHFAGITEHEELTFEFKEMHDEESHTTVIVDLPDQSKKVSSR